MSDIQKQRPFDNKQGTSKKNPVPRTEAHLSGYIANSFNGGHNRTIAWKQVLAGERHKQYKVRMNIKMLTPLTPTYQALKCTLRAYFVPNSRVWDNAEAFQAQNPTNANTPKEYPNLGNCYIPFYGPDNQQIPITQTEQYRDMFVSSYIPRLLKYSSEPLKGNTINNYNNKVKFPKINVLPLRGRVAIYNDFERRKDYDGAMVEFKDDTVSVQELENYFPINTDGEVMSSRWFAYTESGNQKLNANMLNLDYYQMRAKKDDSYYTDYRTEIGTLDTDYNSLDSYMKSLENDGALIEYTGGAPDIPQMLNSAKKVGHFTWADWENLIAESRSQAENANLTDWEIIAKIRGSKLLTEGKVQLIGQKTFNLNNKAVTQTSNNNAEGIDEMFKSMGTQGAYSYTEVEVPLYSGMEFNEDGFVHIIATVSADTVYESGIDATLLNCSWDEQYRPDLKDQKTGYLRELEMASDMDYINYNTDAYSRENSMIFGGRILGYKRKYSEYFKLPNVIAGDMTTDAWVNAQTQTEDDIERIKNGEQPVGTTLSSFMGNTIITKGLTRTNNTFQYFEKSLDGHNMIYKFPVSAKDNYDKVLPANANNYIGKLMWKDYTDLEINKNQAVQNVIVISNAKDSSQVYVGGQNQIFFVGVSSCDAILPINWEVKENATEWGEH